MNQENPYRPPQAALSEPAAPPSRLPGYLVAALVAYQLLATIRHAWAYYELVRTGAAPFLALLLGVPSSLCLYMAAVLLVTTRTRGHRLFLVAGLGLALSVPLWTWPNSWAIVAAFGAVLGGVGWWVAWWRAQHEKSALGQLVQ